MLVTKDKKLWTHICNGEKHSFEELYTTYAKGLYQYGLNFTSKNEVIEDVIQDLFVRIFNNHKNLVKEVNIQSYLIKSFRNNLFRMLEKEKRFFYHDTNEYCFDVTFSVEHRIMATEEELLRKQTLMIGISRLTSKQKEIIYLRFTRGLDYDEISTILSMGVESCRNATYRAIKVLRNELKSTAMVLFQLSVKKS